uniref:Claudin n=1 Tax=Salmo trutta TaxID=8032 RepID=A0A674DVR7_SALTR
MLVQILGLAACVVSGWILVSSALAIEHWTWSEVGSVELTTGNYFSNLWKDCVSNSTGVSDCEEYPSMVDLPGMFWSACHNFHGCVILGRGGETVFLLGFAGLIVYSWWGNKVRSEFVDPNLQAQKFEIGAAVFTGWGGSLLLITGGFVLSFFSGKEFLRSTSKKRHRRPNSYATAQTRRTYMMPNSSRVTPMPQLVQGSRGGRRIRTRTTGTYSRDDLD